MLSLTLSGRSIPLSPDFSMQLTWKNPACDFQKIPQGYGLGLSFPINEYTRAIFGNPHRFGKYRIGNDQKFPGFEIRFSGVLLMSGTLSITSTAGGNYEATLIDQVGVLSQKEQERDIIEIPAFENELIFENKPEYLPGTDAYCCFPIRNPHFFKEKGHVVEISKMVPDPVNPAKQIPDKYDTELLTHLFEATSDCLVNASTVPSGPVVSQLNSNIRLHDPLNLKQFVPTESKVSVVSSFFFLNYVLKKALADSNFSIASSYLESHPALKQLCIYNTYDITDTTFITSISIPKTGFWHGTINIKAKGNPVLYYKRSYSNKVIPKNHLPKIKLGEAILSLQNLFNVCFHFLPNQTVKIYSREQLLTNPAIDLDRYFLGNWEPGVKKNVSIKFTREHDGKDLVFSERFHDLADRKKNIKEPVWDWDSLTDLPATEGDIRYLSAIGVYAEYKWITISTDDPVTQKPQTFDVLGWEEASIGLQDGWYKYGREEVEEIKSSWSTPFAYFSQVEVEQIGNTGAWPSKEQAFAPRLMFNTPGERHSGGNSYDYAGVPAGDTVFMEYEKPTSGLFARYWKQWLRFWADRLPVSGSFDLPVNVLRHVIYNICSKYRTREGEFIIDEMSCELSIDRIGETEIKAYKID